MRTLLGRVRCMRPRAWLKFIIVFIFIDNCLCLRKLPIPKGLSARAAARGLTVRRRSVTKIKAKQEELDWSEKSREVFENAMDKGTEVTKAALDAWETADDKPAVIAIAIASFTLLYAANVTLGAMENVPLIGLMLKVIGLYVTCWFAYRMTAFESERDALVTTMMTLSKKITGE